MYDEPLRPDPDQLLAQVTERPRGKLKIFFGACAGVGKTYAMLKEAQRLREQGIDVLAGVVETHGRSETAALLEGLRILPLKKHNYQGRQVAGFDLDRALAIHPAVILMDELAHTNIPAPATRNAGRMWKSCSMPGSMSSPPSMCSTWKA